MNEEETIKTYRERINDAHKSINSSISLYVVFALTACILIFTRNKDQNGNIRPDKEIRIPFLELEFDKWNGTEIILLFAFVFIFKYFSLKAYSIIMEARLMKKVTDFKEDPGIYPPSVFTSFSLLWKNFDKRRSTIISMYIMLGILVALMAELGRKQIVMKERVPISWILTSFADMVLVILSIIVLRSAYHLSSGHEAHK